MTLVQEVAQKIEVGLFAFDELTLLDIVDQNVQNLQACLGKILAIAIRSSNPILKRPLLATDASSLGLATGLDRGRRS